MRVKVFVKFARLSSIFLEPRILVDLSEIEIETVNNPCECPILSEQVELLTKIS